MPKRASFLFFFFAGIFRPGHNFPVTSFFTYPSAHSLGNGFHFRRFSICHSLSFCYAKHYIINIGQFATYKIHATRLISLCFTPLTRSLRSPTYFRLPLACGSTGFFASSHLPYQINKNDATLGVIFIYGAGDQIVYSHFTSFVGPFPNRNGSNFALLVLTCYFVELDSSNLRHPVSIKLKNGPDGPFLNLMGRATRFELATFGTTNRRSNQLSYARQTFYAFALSVRLRRS